MNQRFPFTPFPTGWFRVATSSDIRPGEVKPLRYFGRDLVVFRTAAGNAHVFDAHCAHLGAHLGYGGRVAGNTVVCPLHGWQWDGEGTCVGIPGSDRLPANLRLRAWPVAEVNGQIMVYHDSLDAAPSWEMPEMPEYKNPKWLRFRLGHSWRIRTHIQEFGENGMDIAHFPYLHKQLTASVASNGLEISGPFLTHHIFQKYNVFGIASFFNSDISGPLDISLYGLGLVVNRPVIRTKIEMRYAFAFFFTPIDDEFTEVYSIASMEKTFGRLLTYGLLRKVCREARITIDQDVPIWEHKLYRPQPKLSEVDGPIMGYRRWASQFYGARDADRAMSSAGSFP